MTALKHREREREIERERERERSSWLRSPSKCESTNRKCIYGLVEMNENKIASSTMPLFTEDKH